jgi:hypothetical protein
MVIGTSGGHESGVGYKPKQDNGKRCPGPCAYNHKDYANYFWLYSLGEAERVANSEIEPFEARPYAFGPLPVFSLGRLLIGADYHEETGRLFIMIGKGDYTQDRYAAQPVLLVYKVRKADPSPAP